MERTEKATRAKYPFHEFFAGSGLVNRGLSGQFEAVWANDISEKKARVYRANFGKETFHIGDISDVSGAELPDAMLSWASFPCQDLSLAGAMSGIAASRSGLVWQWLRVLDELGERAPRVVCLENVTGLVSGHNGQGYLSLHRALETRGYSVGALTINADRFLPQSRPRVFVVGTKGNPPSCLVAAGPTWAHPRPLAALVSEIDRFVWWSLPEPASREIEIDDLVQSAPYDKDGVVGLIPPAHVEKFEATGRRFATAYRRTRKGRQVLELRCDGIAGCLRTPSGGSSRQYLVSMEKDGLHARLLTAREVARLMGAGDDFLLPGSYNDSYLAMGDGVAVPVARHLSENLLSPLVEEEYGSSR